MYQSRKILKGQIYYVNNVGGSFVGSEQVAGGQLLLLVITLETAIPMLWRSCILQPGARRICQLMFRYSAQENRPLPFVRKL